MSKGLQLSGISLTQNTTRKIIARSKKTSSRKDILAYRGLRITQAGPGAYPYTSYVRSHTPALVAIRGI